MSSKGDILETKKYNKKKSYENRSTKVNGSTKRKKNTYKEKTTNYPDLPQSTPTPAKVQVEHR